MAKIMFPKLPKPKYKLVETVEELRNLINQIIDSGKIWSFDIETGYLGEDRAGFSLHPETAFVVGFSFCFGLDAAYYVALEHDMSEDVNLPKSEVAPLWWSALRLGKGVPHNAKFELRQLASFFRKYLSNHPIYGKEVAENEGYYPVAGDTFLMAYCVAEHKQFGLKFLTKELYDHSQMELLALFPPVFTKTGKPRKLTKKEQDSIRFNRLEVNQAVIDYACEDAYWTYRLKDDLLKFLNTSERIENFKKIYALEMRTLRSVCAMEDMGIAVDWGMLKKAAIEGAKFKDRLHAEIMEELSNQLKENIDINLTSPIQVSDLLFNKFGLTINRYTKSTKNLPPEQRKMAADAQTLKTLSKELPVLKTVIQWREMKTLLTRYLTNYETDYSYAEDGHLHPDLFAAGTITGRFSAAHPNYQQLPKRYYFKLKSAKAVDVAHEQAHGDRFPVRTEKPWKGIEFECECGEFEYEEGTVFDFNFRLAIIAPEGWKFFGFDLSQAELRAIAGEAEEPAMMEAFASGIDIHTKTTALMLKKPVELVTKKERGDVGKMLNFALGFMLSPEALGEKLGYNKTKLPGERESEAMREGKIMYEKYFGVYPNIRVWQDRQIAKVKTQGYVTSRFGRRIPLWDLESKERWIRAKADRVAVNGPIQGGATGDNVKRMMGEIHDTLWNSKFRTTVKMVMNVHDALEFYTRNDVDINEVMNLIEPIINRKVVPQWADTTADWHVGDRWGAGTELEVVNGVLVPKDEKGKEKDSFPSVVPLANNEQPDVAIRFEEEDDEELPDVAQVQLSRTLVIEMLKMPEIDRFRVFMNLINSVEGPHKIKMVLPEFTEMLEGVATGITPLNSQEISKILDGARVRWMSETVDKSENILKRLGL